MKTTGKEKLCNVITLGIAAVLALLLIQGCSASPKQNPSDTTGIPNLTRPAPSEPKETDHKDDAGTVVTIGPDGRVIDVKNANGQKFVPCFLCPPEYVHENPEDPHCETLRKRINISSQKEGITIPNVCGGLTNASTNLISPFIFMATHKNPDCTFVQALGDDVAIEGSASHEQLETILRAFGFSPEKIDYILANPKENCSH